MRVKRLHMLKMIEVFEEKLGLMRELAKREGTTIQEPLDDTREKTSHQISSN
jgi:hypothetical protein